MADVYTITTEGEEALAAATRECVLQIRGATAARARIIAWGISFDGTSATAEPVLVQLERQSTDGTATTATVAKLDTSAPNSPVSGFHSFTAQPTAGNRLEEYEVHPQGGMLIREYPPGRQPQTAAATTDRIGITATAPAAVNVVAWLTFEA